MLSLSYFLCINAMPIIVLFIANKIKTDDNFIVAFGASNTIVNLALMPIVMGMASVIEILGSQAYGSEEFYLFGCYINRTRILGVTLLVSDWIIMILLESIYFNLMDFNATVRNLTRHIMIFRMLASLIDLEYNIMLRYMQITGNGIIGCIMCLVTFCSFPFYCYMFVYVAQLGSVGIGLSYLCCSLTNIVPIWVFVLYTKPNEESIFFFNRDSFEGLFKILKLSMFLIFIMIMDYFNTEIMTILAKSYNKTSYVSFILAISIYMFFNSFYLSYNVLTCVSIAFYVGRNDIESSKKIISYIIIDATIIAILLLSITIPIRNILASMVNNDPIIISETATLLLICSFINLVENYSGIFLSILKGLKRLKLSLILYIILNLLMVTGLIAMNKITNFGISVILIFNFFFNIFAIFIYGAALKIIDWNEDFAENKNELAMDLVSIDHKKLE